MPLNQQLNKLLFGDHWKTDLTGRVVSAIHFPECAKLTIRFLTVTCRTLL